VSLFNGNIREVRILPRSLSLPEVRDEAQAESRSFPPYGGTMRDLTKWEARVGMFCFLIIVGAITFGIVQFIFCTLGGLCLA